MAERGHSHDTGKKNSSEYILYEQMRDGENKSKGTHTFELQRKQHFLSHRSEYSWDTVGAMH